MVLARAADVPDGERLIVTVNGRSIGIFNVGGRFYAFLNRCPHRGAQLCKGDIVGRLESDRPGEFRLDPEHRFLACPWHGWEFDLATGESWFDPARTKARPFRVDVETGQLVAEELADGRALELGEDMADFIDPQTRRIRGPIGPRPSRSPSRTTTSCSRSVAGHLSRRRPWRPERRLMTTPRRSSDRAATRCRGDGDHRLRFHNSSGGGFARYLPERWQHFLATTGRRNFDHMGATTQQRPLACRLDALPPNGGVPGSDADFAREQLLDAYGINVRGLNCLESLASGGSPVEFEIAQGPGGQRLQRRRVADA